MAIHRGVICAALMLLVAAGNAVARNHVTAIRASAGDDGTRVVLDLKSAADYHYFTLESPARVVVDIRDTVLDKGVKDLAPVGHIREFRTGVQPKNTLRVVIETPGVVPSKAMSVAPSGDAGHRLVIDLGAGVPTEAHELRAIVARHAPTDSGRDIVVAVDAGHGGTDPGAIGHGGTYEKTVVLAIARELARQINAEPGMRAVLTRDSDQFIALRERIRRARAAKADLFVSIHADSVHSRDVSGASVYVLSEGGATSEAARWLAERENSADLMGGVSLSDKDKSLASVLLDLSQSAQITTSMTVAQSVLSSIDGIGEVRKSRVQQAGFLVLKSPDIPSLLIETAYISNRADERRLKSGDFQKKLATAIVGGVRSHFTANPPEGTHFAQTRRLADRGGPGANAP